MENKVEENKAVAKKRARTGIPQVSDFSLILAEDPTAESHAGWEDFKRMMFRRKYAAHKLTASWHWFKSGWDLRSARVVP